jgi:hypothetical protein
VIFQQFVLESLGHAFDLLGSEKTAKHWGWTSGATWRAARIPVYGGGG